MSNISLELRYRDKIRTTQRFTGSSEPSVIRLLQMLVTTAGMKKKNTTAHRRGTSRKIPSQVVKIKVNKKVAAPYRGAPVDLKVRGDSPIERNQRHRRGNKIAAVASLS